MGAWTLRRASPTRRRHRDARAREAWPMLTDDLRKLLIQQIGHELSAHQLYMAISIYFAQQSLVRWAKVFRDQSMEEAQHATRIMDFLIDNQIDFDLPALR